MGSLVVAPVAQAFIVAINPGTRAVYLRVGDGAFTGTYQGGGIPGNLTTVNRVSVSVAANAVGNGVDQPMTSSATQTTSNWDGYVFCNLPAEVYIGGFFRRPGSSGTATLTATAPANLTSPGGTTIPFSQISWLSTGNSEDASTPQPILAGAFTGAAQTLASFPGNTWRESCHSFRYANDTVVAAGVYTGRVVYTLVAP